MARRLYRNVCAGCGEKHAGRAPLPRCTSCQQSTCEQCAVPSSVEIHDVDDCGEGPTVEVVTATCLPCRRRDDRERARWAYAEDAQEYLDRRAGL